MDIWELDPTTMTLLPGGPRQAQVPWNRRSLPADDPKRYAMPANATPIAPPAEQQGYKRSFIDGAWTQVEDHVGETVYDKATGAPRKIKDLGPLPDGVTTLAPGPFDTWDDVAGWTEDAAARAAALRAAIVVERDRRVDAGFSFDGAVYQSRPGDRENIAAAGTLAAVALMNGAQPGDLRWADIDTDFVWIAADNALVAMDAPAMIAFSRAAVAHKKAHIFAARSLKDMDPIPDDYADDRHWP